MNGNISGKWEKVAEREREVKRVSEGAATVESEVVLPLIGPDRPTNEAAPARAVYFPALIVIGNIDLSVGGSGLLASS